LIYVLPISNKTIPEEIKAIIPKTNEKRFTWCYKKYIWESKSIQSKILLHELKEIEKRWLEIE